MDGLTAFVTARLDEDEAAAKLAAREGGTWTQDDPVRRPGSIASLGGPVVYDEGSPDEYQAAHIARHDPARVLREVAAGRAILEWHYPALPPEDAPEGLEICGGEEGDGDTWQMATPWPCPQIRALAAIWSDHPDYGPAWSPAAAGI